MKRDAGEGRQRFLASGKRRRRGAGAYLLLVGPLLLVFGCSTHRSPDELPLPYRQAEDAFRLGDYDRAARAYRAFIESKDGARDLLPRSYYKMALAEYRRERYGECLAILNEMEQRFPRYEWPQAYTLRGDAELKRGNTATAMLWWERAWAAADDDERDRIAQRIRESISGLNRATLERARETLTTREIRELVDSRIGQVDRGEPPDLRAGEPKGRPAPPRGVEIGGGRIGCLLPLSGTYAVYGQRSLDAIRLALGPEAGRLVVRDTAGRVETARTALNELVADPIITAVIGPLRSDVAAAVAPLAEQAGLPMIALSQREGIAGKFVLQPTMTNERQAAALAEYALGRRGLNLIGIIHPNDAYGNALAQEFRQQVTGRKGRIVGTVAYEPQATEFGVEVLSMKKWTDEGLDAVFLPGYADRTVELARALRQARPELVLLGSNGWHDPPQLLRAARELDGLVFVDGFFAESRRSATRAFVAAYRSAYQAAPEILEAQAYDAASLLLRALEAGARTRADVVPQLMALRSVQGVSGTIAMRPDGLQRELFVLQLVDGTVREAVAPRSQETAAEVGARGDGDSSAGRDDMRSLTGGLR
jgi:ABC-type branched-subunit amino acid transport system substrate-binding protein